MTDVLLTGGAFGFFMGWCLCRGIMLRRIERLTMRHALEIENLEKALTEAVTHEIGGGAGTSENGADARRDPAYPP